MTSEPLAPAAPVFPLDGATGAVVDFYGVVRGQEGNAAIAGLQYEAYREMAERQFRAIAARLAEAHSCRELIVRHRTGPVPVGEPSLHVRVLAAHRGEAFGLARELIDEMKRSVPIWKKVY